jgi:hypothetical protein
MESSDFEKERAKFLEEISGLRKSVEWYKQTYEERSLAGIVYDRIYKKFTHHPKIKINKTHSLLSGKILCIIANHNYSKNASSLHQLFLNYYDCAILDSGSDSPPKNSLKFENIYYSGLLNQAYSIAKEENYKYLLFICSDVEVNLNEASKMFNRLSSIDLNKIGLYSPASTGLSHKFCKKHSSNNLREVPFAEGFIFLCDVEILERICPIDTQKNLYGWGIDIVQSFYAKEKNKLCVVDDNVEVNHLAGTGYSREIAKIEMLSWIKSFGNESLFSFFKNVTQLVES